MKAAYYERQGEARDVLKVGILPEPHPGPGEVRVRVYVSGINPTDIKARTGFSAAMDHALVIPHQDGAGIIDAVGVGVSDTRIGERVWIFEARSARASGTAAEYVIVPAFNAVLLPENVSFEIGASLGIPALTAHRCLFADGPLFGRRVLIHGGAGVVGNAAIMLAKQAGAWVATTVLSDSHFEQARAAGADLVINLKKEDVAAVVKAHTDEIGVERIVDVNLKANLEINLSCLAQGGVISSYATGQANDEISLPLLKAMIGGCVFRFVYIYNVPQDAKRSAIKAISDCLLSGSYSPTIALQLPLDEIVTAHEAIESGTTVGKVLLRIE
ncbi:NADPH:quinone reductase [Brucella pseudogrignonensis]|uniref:NADPH:quinone reductase n=1 Tax=Brucella pseudogrignonensis TaxID=419475 RepID=UPI00124BE3F1|nr:NADPH:quinone reductase [Brucella pseudogrignonensis]KAB2684479.1 NADPH:quinone reductase [Brucella pseudogrignonensis]